MRYKLPANILLQLIIISLISISTESCKKEDATIQEDYGYPIRIGVEPDDTVTGVWESYTVHSIEKYSFREHCSRYGIPQSRLIEGVFNDLVIYEGAGDVYKHSDLGIFDSLELYLNIPNGKIFLGSLAHPINGENNHWDIVEQDLLEHVIADHDYYTLRYIKNSKVDSTEVFTVGMNYHLKTD